MLDPELPTTSEPALSPWDGHRRVLASAAIWGSVTLLAKFVAFGKDWLVARRFGAGDELDAFLVALLIPTYAVAVLSNSFASGFLPTYLRLWQREGKAAAGRLISSALAAAIMLLVAVILLLSVLSLWLLPLLGEGFDSAKLALAQSLFYVLAGMVAITGVSAVLAAVLNAHERFTITAWAPLAVPLGTIAVFGPFEGPDAIEALAWGTLLGYALEAAVLATVAEADHAGDLGEEGVVLAAADLFAGLQRCATLANDDGAAGDGLAGEELHAEALSVRVAAVAGGTTTFGL